MLISKIKQFGNVKLLAALLFGIFGVLYLLAISPYWNISPDSAVYVFAGESIASGEGFSINGEPAPFYPPGTSSIYAFGLLLFPNNYLALNTIVTIFSLASVIICVLLFRSQTTTILAISTALFTIGAVQLFYESTRLLSDVMYFFFSTLSILLVQKSENSETNRYFLVTFVTLFSCFIRPIGLSIPLAVYVSALPGFQKKGQKPKPLLLILMAIPILFLGIWNIRNQELSFSYLQISRQVFPWVEESGYLSVWGIIQKVVENLESLNLIGISLTNQVFWHSLSKFKTLALVMEWGLAGLMILGLGIALVSKRTLLEWYTLISLGIPFVWYPELDIRWFLPVLPFLFYYMWEGLTWIAKRILGRKIIWESIFLTLYLTLYLGIGADYMLNSIPAQKYSDFKMYPIKYPSNTDMLRITIWMRDNLDQEDNYTSQHPIIWNEVTGLNGFVFPFTYDQEQFYRFFERENIQYILADKNKRMVSEFLIPIIINSPEYFSLIMDTPEASLYRYLP